MSTIENIVKSLAYATEHNQGLHLTHEEVPALNARIAELEAAQRWIPVGEQLPDPNDGHNVFVLTVDDLDNPRIYGVGYGSYYIGKDCLPSWSLDFDAHGNFVTHWMPLPKPPEVKE